MSKVVLKPLFLKVSNKKYFRSKSETLGLGSYGKKEVGLFKSNYLFQFAALQLNQGDVKQIGPYSLDVSKTSKVDANIEASHLVAQGSVNLSYEALKDQKLVFMQFNLSALPLMEAMNADTVALDYLRVQKRARVVDAIFVALQAEFAEKIKSSAGFSVSSMVNGIEISISSDKLNESESTLVLPPQTTIAYGMVVPIWNAQKTKVVDFNPDLKGTG